MRSLRPLNWKWQWTVFAVLLSLGLLAMLEPETAEPATTMIGLGAIGCVLWVIWRLMQED
ncbi:MAG: hypothetical protein AB7V58_00600 [Solirubrobacterales bacterium]